MCNLIVILHKIYASAREKNTGEITGEDLAHEVALHGKQVYYFTEPPEAVPFLRELLKDGDIFITMGAGDNWHLGKNLYHIMQDHCVDEFEFLFHERYISNLSIHKIYFDSMNHFKDNIFH